jgi:hypothetical protein
MIRILFAIAALAAAVNAAGASPQADLDRAPQIVAAANSWHEGERIPPELRTYYHSPGDMPVPMDTESLMSEITNEALLAALAVDLGADRRCREGALTQGTYYAGPVRFFALIRARLDQQPNASDPWITEVLDRMARRHVVVDALDIRDSDMPAATASKVLDRIDADLKRGISWETVYRKYADEYGYKTGNRTKIGNLGHFVVFPDPAFGTFHYRSLPGEVLFTGQDVPRRLARLAYFEPSHLTPIMEAHVHDVLRLRDQDHKEWVLYQVQEVYEGRTQPPDVQSK